MMSTVLVTGGSGFIGSYCILELLNAGYQVRTTVRSLQRENEVRELLRHGGVDAGDRLSFVAADLLSDAGWPEAVAGCEFVLHVASPLPAGLPKHEDDLILPAREGTLRVLRAARDAGVRRVVVTSSFAAIGYGQKPRSKPFDETDWSVPEARGTTAYARSKTFAERAAWEFMAREGGKLELAVVNPVAVFGPVLGADFSSSIQLVKTMLEGLLPGCPKLWFGAVDVRDVANLHLRAMIDPAARGERFLALAGDFVRMIDIARVLKNHLGASASRLPTRELPNFLVRLAALRNPMVKLILPELGKKKNGTNAKALRLLGWTPRTTEQSVIATAESLLALGLVKQK